MTAGRARILFTTVVALGLLVPVFVVPAAAATCALSAPASVQVGTPLDIQGSGFPVSSSVDISIGLEGATPDQFGVQSDGAGAFTINLTPEPADAGRTSITASAGATCSASAVFTVTSASATATPTSNATAAPNGSTANPPRTDAAPGRAAQVEEAPEFGWAVGLLILLLGLSGVVVTRRTAGR